MANAEKALNARYRLGMPVNLPDGLFPCNTGLIVFADPLLDLFPNQPGE